MSHIKTAVIIKPFRRPGGAADERSIQEDWNSLSNAMDEIYARKEAQLKYEEVYRFSYNLVLRKQGRMVYTGIESKIREYLAIESATLASVASENLLKEILAAWHDHTMIVSTIRDVMLYVDRNYVPQNHKLPVYSLGLKLFREVVVLNALIRDRFQNMILASISSERNSCIIDRFAIKGLLAMLQDVSVDGVNAYEDEFEAPFLSATREFYRQESQEYLHHNTVIAYIFLVEKRLSEEEQRLKNYLIKSSAPKLKQILDAELISAHVKYINDPQNNTGSIYMMKENKISDLKRLYLIFSRVASALELLRESFGAYVRSCGVAIIDNYQDNSDPVLFMNEIFEIKDKFENIIKESFPGDKKAQKRMKEAFDYFINKGNSCARQLAAYLDEFLKNGLKGLTESEVEVALDRSMSIFQHLTDKDLFENFYKQLLSKRLLNSKTISDEAEKTILTKLKAECGYQFTSKLEGMFVDISMSKNIMTDYISHVRLDSAQTAASAAEIDIQILTSGYWPLQAHPECPLPDGIVACVNDFTNYYLRKNNGKKLTWIFSLGSADIKANFPLGRRELNVSTYQMCILNLFNQSESWSLSDIRSHCTNIPEMELRRHLLSLCTPKLQILKKVSKGKGIEDDDICTFNSEFTSKFKRIKVPLVSAKEVGMESSGPNVIPGRGGECIPSNVEEARKTWTEASIVRIMKTRKRLVHNELITEVIRQVSNRFTPTPAYIKQRVEILIEREYLERDKNDPKVYNYLA